MVLNMETWKAETFVDISSMVDRVPDLPYRAIINKNKDETFKIVRFPYMIWKARHHKSARGCKK